MPNRPVLAAAPGLPASRRSLRLAALDGKTLIRPGPAKRPALAAEAVPARQHRAIEEAVAEARQVLAIAERSEAVAEAMLRATFREDAILIQALARENTIQTAYTTCRVRNLLEILTFYGVAP